MKTKSNIFQRKQEPKLKGLEKTIYCFFILFFLLLQGCNKKSSELEIFVTPGYNDGSPIKFKNKEILLGKEDYSIRFHVNVILINKTKKEMYVEPQFSQNGWHNIEFIFKDSNGKAFQVKSDLTHEFLEKSRTITLPPGGVYVRDCFILGWEWSPDLSNGIHHLKGYAVYNGAPKNDSHITYGNGFFLGIVKSNEFELIINTNSPTNALFD